jgi:hypothetical protein
MDSYVYGQLAEFKRYDLARARGKRNLLRLFGR